jgi:excisionase family DNA binding protein
MDLGLNILATNRQTADAAASDTNELRRCYVTPEEFVKLSGLSLSSVRRYLADGRLPKYQPGGHRCRVLIPRDALERLDPAQQDTPCIQITTNETSEPETMPPDDLSSRSLAGPLPRWRRQSR